MSDLYDTIVTGGLDGDHIGESWLQKVESACSLDGPETICLNPECVQE
jgi:hypothetical protein